jgi:hypothetical protein
MKRPMLYAALSGILAVSLGGGYIFGAGTFAASRQDLGQRIRAYSDHLQKVRKQREARGELDAKLAGFVDRTLGGKFELVDNLLRTRLNRIGEEVGLRGQVVGTSPTATQVGTPAKARYTSKSARQVRDEADFVELEGSISGEGTLEQALLLLHRLDAESWLKRVQQFKLEPRENGERFTVMVRLTTLFLPDREPQMMSVATFDPARFAPYAALAAANPFRVPPPGTPAPQPPIAPQQSQSIAVASFGYGQWKVTGVAEGPGGLEVWLHNPVTRESRTLTAGQKLHEAELVAAAGEQAEFRLGDQQFFVAIGRSLDDRTPVKR